jgi:hypothetical protein
MPVVLDKNLDEAKEEEQQDQQQPQQAAQGGIQTSAGQTAQAGASAGGGAGGQFAGKKKGTGSGRFTNLQKYVQGNVQSAKQTSGRLAEGVENPAEQIESQITGQQQEQVGQIEAAGQAAQKEIGEGQQAFTSFKELEAKAPTSQFSNIYKEIGEASQAGQNVQNQLGDIQAEGVQDFTTQIQDVEEQAQALTTERGRQAALQRMAERPTYTQGQSALDTLVTGGGEAGQRLVQAQEAVQQRALSDDLTNYQSTLQTEKDRILGEVQSGLRSPEEGQGLLDQIDAEIGNINTQLQQRETDFRNQLTQMVEEDQISDLGLLADRGVGGLDVFRAADGEVRVNIGTDANGRPLSVPASSLQRFIDVQSDNIDRDFTEAELDPQAVARRNFLQRAMAGEEFNEAALQEELAAQGLDPNSLVNFQSRVGDLESTLGQDLYSGVGAVSNTAYDPNFESDLQNVINVATEQGGTTERSASRRDAIKGYLTPAQQAEFDQAFADYQRIYDGRGPQFSDAGRKFIDLSNQAVANMQQQQAIRQAIQNKYGGALNYDDILGLNVGDYDVGFKPGSF